MTTKVKKFGRSLFLIILCMLLVYSCAGQSFLGPGISAETVMGSISATDMVVPITGEVRPMATTVPQVKNVVARLTVKRGDIGSAQFNVIGTTSAELHKYDCVDITPERLDNGIWEEWDTNRTLEFIISTNAYTANTRLMDLCFNVPFTVATPLNTIRFQEGTVYTTDWNRVENAIGYTEVLVGDVDQNGAVSANDALKILQFVTDPEDYPLTEAQQLAADTDRNNIIQAIDALAINKYAVQTLASFWDEDQINLPIEPHDSIVSSSWYRIKNVQTGQYIMGGNTANTKYQAAVGTPTNTSQSCLKFQINHAQNNGSVPGCFSLRCLSFPNDSLYLKLDSNYELTLSSTQGEYLTGSNHWYILPVQGGYRLVNRAVPKRALTDFGFIKTYAPDCQAAYAEPGSVWELEPIVTIAYYYDQGYNQRYPNNKSTLVARQQEIATIIQNVFKLSVAVEEPGNTSTGSFADGCSAGLNANCSCSGRTATTCKTYNGTTTFSKLHHKNASGLLNDWLGHIPLSDRKKIRLMTSGHIPCSVNNGENHEYNGVAGLANPSSRVAVVYRNQGNDTEYRERLTALHEISHCLGAVGGTVDQHHNNGRCVMSNGSTRDNETLLEYWNDKNYSALYCTDCKTKVAAYVLTF